MIPVVTFLNFDNSKLTFQSIIHTSICRPTLISSSQQKLKFGLSLDHCHYHPRGGGRGLIKIAVKIHNSYLRNAKHLRIENEQRHLFKVNSFDHKDDVLPELRKELSMNSLRNWGTAVLLFSDTGFITGGTSFLGSLLMLYASPHTIVKQNFYKSVKMFELSVATHNQLLWHCHLTFMINNT